MSEHITVHGIVATEPRHLVTSEGLPITTFRLASLQRWFDRRSEEWKDKGTNWYSVVAFRLLAQNAATSFNKGDRVIVTGRLMVKEWETSDSSGRSVEIEADSLGHDLLWGTTVFQKHRLSETDSDDVSDPEPKAVA